MDNPGHYDIVGIGNAIIDILVRTEDQTLKSLGLTKGNMSLIDGAMAEKLFHTLPATKQMSGGGAANTVVAMTSFGAKGAFIGKVSMDIPGERFSHMLMKRKIAFSTSPEEDGTTAISFIIVTPDHKRTMCTHLGVSGQLCEKDVDEDMVGHAAVTILEAYVCDGKEGYKVMERASAIAKSYGRKIALALSDSECVKRHIDFLRPYVEKDVDVLFANEREIQQLFGAETHDEAVQSMIDLCTKREMIAALTCGPRGAIVVNHEGALLVKAKEVEEIVDTTGVGSLFAGGFLYGLLQGYSMAAAGKLANYCAAEGLKTLGARVQDDLMHLLEDIGDENPERSAVYIQPIARPKGAGDGW